MHVPPLCTAHTMAKTDIAPGSARPYHAGNTWAGHVLHQNGFLRRALGRGWFGLPVRHRQQSHRRPQLLGQQISKLVPALRVFHLFALQLLSTVALIHPLLLLPVLLLGLPWRRRTRIPLATVTILLSHPLISLRLVPQLALPLVLRHRIKGPQHPLGGTHIILRTHGHNLGEGFEERRWIWDAGQTTSQGSQPPHLCFGGRKT